MPQESKFEHDLIRDIYHLFPEAIVLKNDANNIQGFPDRLILYKDKWAAFEVKATWNSHRQPNQEYYVELLNGMSFAWFVFPENKEAFLYELQQAFRHNRPARVFKRK
jgi:hypothetical protein